jgi:hypothetical protein
VLSDIGQLITFEMLPNGVLLKVFDFHVGGNAVSIKKSKVEGWITLAHVCRRWRSVLFQSSRRLNLRLFCTPKTPAEDTLDIWPPLPLIVVDLCKASLGAKNILAALKHNHRMCKITIMCDLDSELKYYTNSTAMQKPFPELTDLSLEGYYRSVPILPDSFLGGNAPRLRSLLLGGISFPGLPKLLLTATHLVDLELRWIPRYIPPEAMATGLSGLTNLESLTLEFTRPRTRPAPESQRPPPLTRSILPSLTKIKFKGTSEYLEEILARIDAPQLDGFYITFFNRFILDTPQLFQFISRRPALRAPQKGHVAFDADGIVVKFQSQTSDFDALTVNALCTASDWPLSSISRFCTSSLPPPSTLEDLYIFEGQVEPPLWPDDVESTLWLGLLHPFAAAKNLYLCERIAPRIAPALQELVGARTTEELPTLENIFLEGFQPSGPVQEGIEKFVAARQLTSRPIAVSRWDRDPDDFGIGYPYYFAKFET